MERVRRKKSKVPTVTEGNRLSQRRRSVLVSSSEPSSNSSSIIEDDLLTRELGRSLSRRVTGTPIKKLLAEEMSKETEPRIQRTSVVARLMGLDELSPLHPVHIQSKGFSEMYHKKTASVGYQSNGKPNEHRLDWKYPTEQQEFKDVYEVSETTKFNRDSKLAKGAVNKKVSEAEMTFVQQKFADEKAAKRLTIDEKLYNSGELCDAVDMVDTNKDLLIKFLQQPDFLFTKHILDLEGSASGSQCSHKGNIKPSNEVKYYSSTIGRKSEKETSCDSSTCSKHQRVSTQLYDHCGAKKPPKSTKNQLEGKHEPDILPTRIVVLKPNRERLRNATKSASSPCSSHGYRSDCRKMEYPRIVTAEVGVKTYLAGDVDFPLRMSVESREIAKKITRRIRESFVSEPMDLSSTFKGYAGDESSYTVSGSDSASESDMTLTSRKSFHHSNQPRVSSSHTIGSSVSKEAKKRLSERWKMSHRYQAVEAVAKGSTLGEMLAKPDKEMRAESLDPMIGLDGSSNRFSGNEIVDWNSPSGISSRDGWKDGQLKSSSGLKSVPAAYVGCGGPKTSMQRETLDQDSYLMLGKARARGRNEAIKGGCNKKKDSLSRKLRTSSKKPSDSFEEKQFKPVEMETKLRKIDVSAKQYLISEVPANTVHGSSSITDVEVDAENNDIIVPSESRDEVLPGPSPCWLENGCSSTPSPEDSKAQEPQNRLSAEESVALQHLVPEPSSPASSKEADHPSPVSVLELPFTEDPSSGSECLERVSADLQALRMQLKLLKMESGEYEDREMLIASDKDVGQSSIRVSEETALFEVCNWESSFIIDVLIDSGFDHADPGTIMRAWHSLEYPLDSLVFDQLEKKYCNDTRWSMSERRLLFDRMNSGLCEIFQPFMDPCPWVKPPTRKFDLWWLKLGVKHHLCKFLADEEKKASEDVTEKVLDREMQWLDHGDATGGIVRELEKLLINDLLAEVAACM